MPEQTQIYIITDSITNSVFEGLVLAPILKKLDQDPTLNVILFSFESNILHREEKKKTKDIHERLKIKLFYRPHFWGRFTLRVCILTLQHNLQNLSNYTITARGALAGWIALRGTSQDCSHITIQARGLLAEEYWYANRSKLWQLPITWVRYRQFKALERKTYQKLIPAMPQPTTIEVVSKAMKQHFIDIYKIDTKFISMAAHDIPPIVAATKIQLWHKQIREQLNIPHNRYIYCYAGSGKTWHCPEKIIQFFTQELKNNPQSYLLILSQDAKIFQEFCDAANLKSTDYHITHVPHDELFQYMSAADAGLIFRENHILNWVSRPTKILEYQSVGLKIIHNNTVELLTHTQQ